MTGRHLPAWLRRRGCDVVHRDILQALGGTLAAGDPNGMRALLHHEVEMVVDTGGDDAVAFLPHAPTSGSRSGADAVVSGLCDLTPAAVGVETAMVNDLPGLLFVRDGLVVGVLTAQLRDGLVRGIWVVCNPAKLGHWNR